jgi:hypothetical protein
MGSIMLQYLLSHPEHAFTPPETADLCEAFDMAVAVLQERGDSSINWTDEEVRAALSGEIVAAWNRGERDVRQLSDRAVLMADQGRGAQRRA